MVVDDDVVVDDVGVVVGFVHVVVDVGVNIVVGGGDLDVDVDVVVDVVGDVDFRCWRCR